MEDLKSVIEKIKTEKSANHSDEWHDPGRKGPSTTSSESLSEESRTQVKRPTDAMALKILSHDHGALIRKTASEVRSGARVADL